MTGPEPRAAADAAVAAQAGGRAPVPRARVGLFHGANRLMPDRAETFARGITLDSGRPLIGSRAEFDLSADFLRSVAEQIAHRHGTFSEAAHGGFRVGVTHRPVGPALLITPRTLPPLMFGRKTGAAPAADCAAVVRSALVVRTVVRTTEKAGLPAGVPKLLRSTRAGAISEAVMAGPRQRELTFTGRPGWVRSSKGRDAADLTRASLELVAAGGAVLAGGDRVEGPGYLFRPAMIGADGANRAMCRHGLFARVATIFALDRPAGATAFASDTRFGFALHVLTRKLSRALAFGERPDFGMVGIDCGIMADAAAPFGGDRASGIGREAGHGGLYEVPVPKYVAVRVEDPFRGAR